MDIWIWTELFAFDNDALDLNEADYFANLKTIPEEITLLIHNTFYGNTFVALFRKWLGNGKLPVKDCHALSDKEQDKQRMHWMGRTCARSGLIF